MSQRAPHFLEHHFDASESHHTIIEHWAKARIDSPLTLIAKFDDASKQLIAVAGALQGLYLAAFAFSGLTSSVPSWYVLLLFGPLLVVVVFATKCVCTVPLTAEAHGAYKLLERGSLSQLSYHEVSAEFQAWCQKIDAIAEKKRQMLHAANLSFIAASAAAALVLLMVMMNVD